MAERWVSDEVARARRAAGAALMARPDFPRSIVKFQRHFADEEARRAYLFASRWPGASAVDAAAGAEKNRERHRSRHVWRCKACGEQSSVTADTVAAAAPAESDCRLERTVGITLDDVSDRRPRVGDRA